MSLEVIVVTPQGEVFSESAEQVVLPGSEGDFGVLEQHEKFLSPLRPGPMEIQFADGHSEWAALSDGFAEVTGEEVVVLVDECFKAHEIDLEHAQHTRAEAEQELADLLVSLETEEHRARLENTIVRLSAQIEVARRGKH
ncbi:MAG: ATP synthase F1 subunit epsilon [Myxococcota bacterium]